MPLNLKIFKICIMHEFAPKKGKNMQTCTEKVSLFGVVNHKMNICKVLEV